jgi:hypothetical protein
MGTVNHTLSRVEMNSALSLAIGMAKNLAAAGFSSHDDR